MSGEANLLVISPDAVVGGGHSQGVHDRGRMKEVEQEQFRLQRPNDLRRELSNWRLAMNDLTPPYAVRLARYALRKTLPGSNPAKPWYFTNQILNGERYEIGDYTYGVPIVHTYSSRTKLKIGKYCSIADQVTILLGGNHRLYWATTYPFTWLLDEWPEAEGMPCHMSSEGDVVIGNDVWIGQEAFILSGVTIGHGAVVGARAVVAEDVEPYSIVAGNPARLVRKRFDDKVIERLLEMAWWDWPVEKIRKNLHLLCSNNLDGLLSLKE